MSDQLKLLDELIPKYAVNKSELDNYKKICEGENAQIKRIMDSLALLWYKTDKYKITRVIQKREKLREDVLLDLFMEDDSLHEIANQYNLIKTQEYIDIEALEQAIYKGGLSDDDLLKLNKAKETKEVVTLRLSKNKGDKDNVH